MEKIIKVGEQQIRLKASASFALRYKSYFQKDVLKIIFPMLQELIPIFGKIENNKLTVKDYPRILSAIEKVEIVDLYQIIWTLAKTADPEIKPIVEWLDEFEEFPLSDIIPEVYQLIVPTLIATKESKKK